MDEKIRGVNLGNWLVLEKWMEPENFAGTDAEDETWLARKLPREELERRLKKHRDTYITSKDFAYIKTKGMNTVRIPVPYFIFGDVKPFIGCIEYLDKAFEWAEEFGLKILIDLHTAPGGQNGYDNGGITGVCRWHKDPAYVRFVINVLMRLAYRYGEHDKLFGIEVLNEPISWSVYMTSPTRGKAADPAEVRNSGHVPFAFLTTFYKTVYWNLRKILPLYKAIVFHDGFRLHNWNCFFRRNEFRNVYLDAHIYLSAMENFTKIHDPLMYKAYLGMDKVRLKLASKSVPVLIGEWCINNSYAGDMPEKGLAPEEYKKEQAKRYRRVAKMELETWRNTEGWFYWNYKLFRDPKDYEREPWKESWDFRQCIKNRWLKL